MQRCAAVRATCWKQETPQLWKDGPGGEGGSDTDRFVLLDCPIVSTILSPIVTCKIGIFWSANDGTIAAILNIAFKMAPTINVPLSFR